MANREDRPHWHKLIQRFRREPRGQVRANELRQKADDSRDARDWAQAATYYGEYLSQRPDDGELWVQFGHALKEDGQLLEGLKAYKEALKLTPGNTDAQLHYRSLLIRIRNSDNIDLIAEPRAEELLSTVSDTPDPDALVIVAKAHAGPYGTTAEAQDAALLADRIRRLRTVA